MTFAMRPRGRVGEFFAVHPARVVVHNRGMIGGTSIMARGATGAGGAAGGLGAIVALFCGALTLIHLVRATAARPAELRGLRLRALRRAIVGVRKNHVAAALGPPRATIGRGDYRFDDTWYYPIDKRRHVALAIQFADGIARQTQVIKGL
jgi:hypothetical protein